MLRQSQILEFLEEDKPCSYFDDKICDIQYRYMEYCSSQEQYDMLDRGWRRFGNMHFVPVCKECNSCVTMRIDVEKFKFTKSHKRLFKKNEDIQVYVQKPTVTMEHIELFNKYHAHMKEKKQWHENIIDVQEYHNSYVNGAHDFGKEILYFKDDKLIAVALSDMMPQALSAVYCYYDHDYDEYSLGKYSILAQISLAKQNKVPYLYLGYWIKDHFSMGYKEAYKPFEVLLNRPSLTEETVWEEYNGQINFK
ncbi:MAG: arginyltransferase [Campylobacterota bacterium]|nr:arginyltransferase [Campylobacterota bacterium]